MRRLFLCNLLILYKTIRIAKQIEVAERVQKKEDNIVNRNYECLYIISSAITEEKRNEIIAKFQKMAGSNTTIEKWGMRKFATPIDYRKDGFYVLMNFQATNDLVAKMTALMNITEGLVRYMFIVKDEKQINADAVRKVQRAENKAKYAAKAEKQEKPATETPAAE